MRKFRSLASLSVLVVLALSLMFFLSGCGFLNQSPKAVISSTPSADGGTITIPAGEPISFDASSSSANGGKITNYAWDFKSDSSGESVTDSGKTLQHTYQDTGTYTVKLTVTDDSGKSDSTSVTVEVVELTASFTSSADSAMVGDAVTFDASGSVGNIESYEWDLKSDRTDSATRSGETVTYTYESAGSYIVKLTVVDKYGFTDSVKHLLTISSETNDPPTASISADKTAGEPPLEVEFDAANSSDPDGTIVSYEWDFDDGQTGSGVQVSHTFSGGEGSSKEYTVVLTVTDDGGAKATDEIEILTIAPPPPPG